MISGFGLPWPCSSFHFKIKVSLCSQGGSGGSVSPGAMASPEEVASRCLLENSRVNVGLQVDPLRKYDIICFLV